MNPIALLLLAFSMSTDAFAAAVGKGASLNRPRFFEALRMGVIFGTIEAITPLIGWLIGKSASSYVEAWDHWIAFFLLLALGLHMVYEGFKPSEEEIKKPSRQSLFKVSITALGTSIDAMAVGVGLAFIDVNIWLAAGLIGLATTLMVTLGVMLGRFVGAIIGHRAEIFGGITLIGVGFWILSSHL
ncbi:manganese efflux pump MntP [Idiomarina aminovorans]|uniref:manganese efflux pump MntP n=1 Tax=Idiomarina aminovorans TaxID=2914829 RepID=UPI00200568C2|nr:manganese efflux pump MntP [Idiomarina sp. ATCH4]MCK7460167.1 manganese efflux pump MntP [Idiomarina sp. ATCH4]